ncbi:hypothetical protein QBC42DRAFT_102607 [Cladorrhinum samala]|uniref:BSD domain-containing protein n=1 Tax=Cladorrhinum samala TaxID=585594 RepID=A0AAV9HY80_9PEZI|nr:hypothetical protein QBC42DRAFT_102607 [Cladorrhinum samala]
MSSAMDIPKGRASYKKKDGILTLTDDRTFLIWSPMPANGPPTVSLALDKILNLKQTPDTSPKVILKIIEKPKNPDEQEGQSFMFQFTSPTDARTEANALRDLLSQLLAEIRGGDPNVPKPLGAAGGPSAAGGPPPNAKPPSNRWYDDDSLKADTQLQQSLLDKDLELAKTHAQALALKSDSISDESFNKQFWSSRVGLLRAHAFEQHQKKGSYNVLSTVKPRAENGEFKLSLSPEQIQSILHQHPLVRRIYNENVPKLSEPEFWSRFFLSKLAKQLRGERITDVDNSDPLFDRYLGADNSLGVASKITAAQHVPHIIDLEGNEENQGGFKSGNRKDAEMRPRANIPIIKTLNSLSEKIMADVAPADLEPSGTPESGAKSFDDARVFNQLSLQDLHGEREAGSIRLNVKDQTKFFSNHGDGISGEDAQIYAQQNPEDVLFEVVADLDTFDDDGAGGIDLRKSIGVDDDSESDHYEDATMSGIQKTPHVGSRAARRAAEQQILEGLRKARAEHAGGPTGANAVEASPMGIPPDLTERCYLTQMTTTEFLKQFWSAFLSSSSSGDSSEGGSAAAAAAAAAGELAYHVESLKRCVERIEAIAAEAERDRLRAAEARKKQIQEHYQKTGKKLKWVPPKGGRDSVMALFEHTTAAIEKAVALYRGSRG